MLPNLLFPGACERRTPLAEAEVHEVASAELTSLPFSEEVREVSATVGERGLFGASDVAP